MKHWRYSGSGPRGFGWWVAFVDEAGCVAFLSDYGDYAYRWGSPGERGIRAFLAEKGDEDYFLRKLARRVPDFEVIRINLKSDIIGTRRRKRIDAEDARDAWRLLSNTTNDEFSITSALFALRDDFGIDVEDAWHEGPSRQARAFMEKVWPSFQAAVRAELAAERSAA